MSREQVTDENLAQEKFLFCLANHPDINIGSGPSTTIRDGQIHLYIRLAMSGMIFG